MRHSGVFGEICSVGGYNSAAGGYYAAVVRRCRTELGYVKPAPVEFFPVRQAVAYHAGPLAFLRKPACGNIRGVNGLKSSAGAYFHIPARHIYAGSVLRAEVGIKASVAAGARLRRIARNGDVYVKRACGHLHRGIVGIVRISV